MSFAERVQRDLDEYERTRRRKPVQKLPPGMIWRAWDREGVGHLLAKGSTRHVCGLRAMADRFAWPVRSQHAECVRLLGEGR